MGDRRTEWTARELLTWLEEHHPARLGLPTYLRLPDAHQDGAICHLTPSGGFLVLYQVSPKFSELPNWGEMFSEGRPDV